MLFRWKRSLGPESMCVIIIFLLKSCYAVAVEIFVVFSQNKRKQMIEPINNQFALSG